MKMLLIRPPATYPKGAINPSAGIPIGLLSIAATLAAEGFAVEILDCRQSVAGHGGLRVLEFKNCLR